MSSLTLGHVQIPSEAPAHFLFTITQMSGEWMTALEKEIHIPLMKELFVSWCYETQTDGSASLHRTISMVSTPKVQVGILHNMWTKHAKQMIYIIHAKLHVLHEYSFT